ncbi:MAG: hypothetical protein AB1555_17750 [Nitrospirota bacterium]
MLALSGIAGTLTGAPNWNIHFAREPEPDLEFEDALEEENGPGRGTADRKPPKRSGGRPLLWVLLLVLVAGGAYVAMDPEIVMDLLGSLLGEPAPAPTATVPPRRPTAPTPAPPAPPAAEPGLPSPMAVPASPPSPLFAEGQQVAVTADPGVSGATVTLSLDAAGTRPGPVVRPGSTLTVLDGEWRNNAWVYVVKTEEGTKGWIPESRLRLKP